MSVRIMTRVWDAAFPTLPMKLIALKLADCANDEGENIYPSVGRVERDTGASSSVVREALADMEASGLLLVVEDKFGNRRGRSTTIRAFDVDRLKLIGDGWLIWAHADVPVRDLKTGEQKRDTDGALKTRKAWRLTQATPPAGGGVAEISPLRLADPSPPAGGGVPLRLADPTPPAGGPPIEEPSIEPSIEPSLTHPPMVPAAARTGGRVEWIEDLRDEGHAPAVLDELLCRLIGAGLATWKGVDGQPIDPRGPGRQVCLDLKADPIEVVEAIREAVLDRARHRLPPVQTIRELAVDARRAAELRREEARHRGHLAEVAVLGDETASFMAQLRRFASPEYVRGWFDPAGVVSIDGAKVTIVTPHRPSLVAMRGESLANAAARSAFGARVNVAFVEGRAALKEAGPCRVEAGPCRV
jgi:hypothetical protein